MSLLTRCETNMQSPELIEKWAEEKRGWRERGYVVIEQAQASEVVTAAQSSKLTLGQRRERVSRMRFYYRRKR